MTLPPRTRHLLAAAYLGGLMLYVFLGVPLTPFHGDESTLIYTTEDYFFQFVERDMAEATRTAPDTDPMDYTLRLLDGRVQKYLGGFAYHLAGGTRADLNRPWDWQQSIAENIENGHFPNPTALMANRLAMATLTALMVPVAFGIGMQVGGWGMALAFPLLLVTSPNILINGRRAMMEAPLMLFALCSVLAAVRWAMAAPNRGGHWPWVLGLSAGLSLSGKLSAVLHLAPLFAALGAFVLWRRNPREVARWVGAGVLAVMILYAFNPTWWPNPIHSVRQMLSARTELLRVQIDGLGGYTSPTDQAVGFLRQTVLAAPQYYEVPSWAPFMADPIAAYEASPWAGVTPALGGGLVLAGLVLIGVVSALMQRTAARLIFLVYALGVLLAALLLTPLEWARYYLIGLPGWLGLAALGLSTVGGWVTRRARATAAG